MYVNIQFSVLLYLHPISIKRETSNLIILNIWLYNKRISSFCVICDGKIVCFSHSFTVFGKAFSMINGKVQLICLFSFDEGKVESWQSIWPSYRREYQFYTRHISDFNFLKLLGFNLKGKTTILLIYLRQSVRNLINLF